MFDNPPGCYMYKQGNFVAKQGGFPDDVLADLDNTVGVFPCPARRRATSRCSAAVTSPASSARTTSPPRSCVKFLAVQGQRDRRHAETGALHLAAHGLRHVSLYPNETLRRRSPRSPTASTEFLFDGSDQMPGEVGAGTFWKEMTAWISGQEDLDTALNNIDDQLAAS